MYRPPEHMNTSEMNGSAFFTGTEQPTISLCLCLILEERGLVSFLGRFISIFLLAFPLLLGQKSTNKLGEELTFKVSQLFCLFLERIYFNFPDMWLHPRHPTPNFGYITALSSAYRQDGLSLVISKSLLLLFMPLLFGHFPIL